MPEPGYPATARNLQNQPTPTNDHAMLERLFSYVEPNPATGPKYVAIREAAQQFAETILTHVPDGWDRTTAIRHIRDAVFTANAGIALNGYCP